MPTYYTSVHMEYYDSTGIAGLHVIILKWTVIITMQIYFDISVNELNVHRCHMCTIPKVHVCKSSDANCCQYICVSVAEIALILKKKNMKN